MEEVSQWHSCACIILYCLESRSNVWISSSKHASSTTHYGAFSYAYDNNTNKSLVKRNVSSS